jgi:hypothetical protein
MLLFTLGKANFILKVAVEILTRHFKGFLLEKYRILNIYFGTA